MREVTVETPLGPGRLVVHESANPRALLLLGHGAGGGIDAFDLQVLAAELPGRGVTVALFEQPWRVAGRKVAPAPGSLDVAWRIAVGVVSAMWGGLALFVGGRSAGARCACRCWAEPAAGAVLMSFPLHPPGRPEKSRAAELLGLQVHAVIIQGSRDPFGSPNELAEAIRGHDNFRLAVVADAAHGLGPPLKNADPGIRTGQIIEPAIALVEATLGR